VASIRAFDYDELPHMTIGPGSRLGPYEVTALIGEGGMGNVYRATDTNLKRAVAIKVLPASFASDAERLARFQREAEILAALNHPNIAAIYGLERSNGMTALVMELVEGPTLADRIAQGAIPVDEALPIARQIAEALEAAHALGIVHRDLKPANIKVRPDGTVKVLDFGLAKVLQPMSAEGTGATAAPTITSPTMTGVGILLGTAAYMSPEQARGKPVDKRTDIWAFGCVVYEVLTGRQAFRGANVTEILAAVLIDEPDWQALAAETPQSVRALLRRCLQKDPKQRMRDAADLQLEIDEALLVPPSPPLPIAPARSVRTWVPVLVTAGIIVAIVTGLIVWRLKPAVPVTRASTAHFVISLPSGLQLDFQSPAMALSPDGSRLAYVARTGNARPQIYVQSIASPEARPLPGTEDAASPFFSPDGQWLAFFARGKLGKISVGDGRLLTVHSETDRGEPFGGGTWGTDDTIVFGSFLGDLRRVAAAGGTPQLLRNTLNAQKGLIAARWPQFLPGANEVLFSAGEAGATWISPQLGIYSLRTGERRDLSQGGTFPRYSPTGHLLYVQNGTLIAAPFDPGRLEITGAQVPVVEGLMQLRSGAAQYSFSDNGTLIYAQGFVAPEGFASGTVVAPPESLVWVDRKGLERAIPAAPRPYTYPRLSPDGQRIGVTVSELGRQVWMYDLTRETLTRLTFEGTTNGSPVWTADGKRVAFSSGSPANLFWQPADGSGKPERLTTSQYPQTPTSRSPDGLVAFREQTPTTGNDIWVLRLSDRKAEPFLRTPFAESSPQFSPDGRWLAYHSDESGRTEVYVRPYPGPGSKWQISTEGGMEPVWNPNGRELFYRNGNKMMAVNIITQPGFSSGKPTALFEGPYVPTPTSLSNYDVSPDGQRFLMLKAVEQQQTATQIHVILNWHEELKRLVPTN
jgi:eukaryotic-like serine/threonine-protein kinase